MIKGKQSNRRVGQLHKAGNGPRNNKGRANSIIKLCLNSLLKEKCK